MTKVDKSIYHQLLDSSRQVREAYDRLNKVLDSKLNEDIKARCFGCGEPKLKSEMWKLLEPNSEVPHWLCLDCEPDVLQVRNSKWSKSKERKEIFGIHRKPNGWGSPSNVSCTTLDGKVKCENCGHNHHKEMVCICKDCYEGFVRMMLNDVNSDNDKNNEQWNNENIC